MTIQFYLRYHTRPGESFSMHLSDGQALPLEYLNDEFWHASVDIDPAAHPVIGYHYTFHDQEGHKKVETELHRTIPAGSLHTDAVALFDYYNAMGALENTFETQPFRGIFLKEKGDARQKMPARFTHIFRVKAPLLHPDEVPCLAGHGNALRQWDTAAPILMAYRDGWWEARIDLAAENLPLGYKYGIWNTRTHRFTGFEAGSNRTIYALPFGGVALHHDNFARFPASSWRGSGVAIPVFSLRSNKSFGVGEFTDLHLLADWARSVGLRLIQLLPINDTSATGTWMDSYPYSAISAFALHPMYLNLAEVAGKAQAAVLKPFAKKQKALNALEAVDYEAVLQTKWAIVRQLFAAQKSDFLKNPDFVRYFTENKHWLVPYAAFCYLRDKNGTADFNQWPDHQVYHEKEVEKLVSPKAAHYDDVAIHYYVQWHLHCQLKAAVEYLHSQGLALKGDIPIGIYRYSCDAWVSPELYNMGMQAGAPPDDFAVNGQNWGFPTYNWAHMKANRFAWWRQRFQQMSLYFDAFRIDHILGFFRIWSIPLHAVEGILGHFVPAIPVTEQELHEAGAGFNYDRFCRPFITDAVLHDLFGDQAEAVCARFMAPNPGWSPGSYASQYVFKPEFDTQRKVEAYLEATAGAGAEFRSGIFALHANVILLDTTPEGADAGDEHAYAFRIGMESTSAFKYLPTPVREVLKPMYVHYFFRRQDDFWKEEALEKLPALKRATNMLICGEDLGMVPHCVPDVMQELGILSLEIQRMPKKTGSRFFHPKDAPYLSVVTPSTHDMSTVRGWWEEDRDTTQRFFNDILGEWGDAPWFCESWINRAIVIQHLHSPAMWAIFQLQDLLGIDSQLRRENPNEERINVPANPKHYWRYRMHLSLEELQQQSAFNDALKTLVRESGRA